MYPALYHQQIQLRLVHDAHQNHNYRF